VATMAMANPSVPIKIDPDTGIWSTDGLPMIYMPRHFVVRRPPHLVQPL
jgi:hypothetical protein